MILTLGVFVLFVFTMKRQLKEELNSVKIFGACVCTAVVRIGIGN